MDRRLTILKDVLLHPKAAFREISGNGRNYVFVAIAILLVYSIGYGIIPIEKIFPKSATLGYQDNLSSQLYRIGSSIGLGFLNMILVYYIGRSLKGKANFRGLFSALQYSDIPLVIASAPFFYLLYTLFYSATGPESYAKSLIEFVSVCVVIFPIVIWTIILEILACREANGFSTGKSIATLLISGLIGSIISYSLNFLIFHPKFVTL